MMCTLLKITCPICNEESRIREFKKFTEDLSSGYVCPTCQRKVYEVVAVKIDDSNTDLPYTFFNKD